MCTFWVLLAALLLLQFGIPLIAAHYGAAVKARFVERGKTIPAAEPPSTPLDLHGLEDWINTNPDAAKRYACPVLFPLDFAFMVALGGVMALGPIIAAPHLPYASSVPWWVWCILPGIYFVADFAEDVLLILILQEWMELNQRRFDILSKTTSMKLKSAVAAIVIPVIVGAASAWAKACWL